MDAPHRGRAALALAAAAILSGGILTACSSSDPESPIATEECPQGEITLRGISSNAGFPEQWQIDAYTADNPCVTIDIQRVPFDQLAETIALQATSANPPDLIGYDGPWTQNLASQGVLAPLDDYLPEGWADDVVPATLAEHSWNGQVYSAGTQQDALMLYYNRDMVEAAGIEVPQSLEDAWTWDEAHAAFQACQQGPASNPTVWGLASSRWGTGAIYPSLVFLRSMGDPEADPSSSAYRTFWGISDDGTTVDGYLNTPEAIAGAEWYQSLFNGDTAVSPKTAIPNSFIDQTACFEMEIVSNISIMEDAGVDFEWGVAPLPYFVTPIVHTGSIALGVSARSQNLEAASEFAVAINTGDYLTEFATARERIPVLNSSIAAIPELNEYPKSIPVQQIQQWGHPRPPTPHFVAYGEYVGDALADIAFGSDAQTRLDELVGQIDAILSQ